MPKRINHEEEETAPKIVSLDDSVLIFQREKEKNSPVVIKQSKKDKIAEAKYNEERENFELIINEFMNYWYDRSIKHPGILYHLKRCDALVGFELYCTDIKQFQKWYRNNSKIVQKARAPYPYNLPSNY